MTTNGDNGEVQTLRFAVITLGGERKERMQEQFKRLGELYPSVSWNVTFVDGVKGSELKSRPVLREGAALLLQVLYLAASLSRLYSSACIQFLWTGSELPYVAGR
jgi:hypothetical protein